MELGIDLFEHTLDITSHLLDMTQEPTGSVHDAYACLEDQGRAEGAKLAAHDIAANDVKTVHPFDDERQAYSQAYAACNVDGTIDHGHLPIPDTVNPLIAFAEVALTPTELNVGEDQQINSPGHFHDGVVAGYDATVADPNNLQSHDVRADPFNGLFDAPHDGAGASHADPYHALSDVGSGHAAGGHDAGSSSSSPAGHDGGSSGAGSGSSGGSSNPDSSSSSASSGSDSGSGSSTSSSGGSGGI